jgi:hypothetical protein
VFTAQHFKQRWEHVEGDRLVAFSDASLSDVRLPVDARAFLVEAGLPEEATPCLNFEPPKSGTLQRVSSIYHPPVEFDRYRIIGGNGSGDPVCLDERADGHVVYLNHDNRFQRVLMASSVFTLAQCLLELRDVIADAGGDTELVAPERYGQLLQRFHTIDPAACESGGYWPQEIGAFQPQENKKWWQVWK